jgi:AcrR family transcriptional regulator
MKNGYSETSTLQIATRAKVSKRELYALVGSKEDILIACITERATRMRSLPADVPKPHDRETLRHMLEVFGARLLTEATHPLVVGAHRLAIAEANHLIGTRFKREDGFWVTGVSTRFVAYASSGASPVRPSRFSHHCSRFHPSSRANLI